MNKPTYAAVPVKHQDRMQLDGQKMINELAYNVALLDARAHPGWGQIVREVTTARAQSIVTGFVQSSCEMYEADGDYINPKHFALGVIAGVCENMQHAREQCG